MNEEEYILEEIIFIAYQMLTAGSKVGRAEQMIEKMCKAYQMEEVEVFIITSSIVVSVKGESGQRYTQTKRIREYQTDFCYLEYLEHLVDEICQERLTAEQIRRRIGEHDKSQEHYREVWSQRQKDVVYCIVCMIFTLFFGGGIREGVASLFCGVFVKLVMNLIGRTIGNRFAWTVIATAVAGSAACFFCRVGWIDTLDKVMIGNIMLLIPGLAMINGMKDLIEGEMLSGLLRLTDAVLQAVAVAIGAALLLVPFSS